MVSENVAYQLQNFEEAEIDESPVNGVLLHFQILSHVGSVWKPAYMMWRQNRLEKS